MRHRSPLEALPNTAEIDGASNENSGQNYDDIHDIVKTGKRHDGDGVTFHRPDGTGKLLSRHELSLIKVHQDLVRKVEKFNVLGHFKQEADKKEQTLSRSIGLIDQTVQSGDDIMENINAGIWGRTTRAYDRARSEAVLLVTNPKEYFTDEEEGKKRRVAAVAAGLAALGIAAYLAYRFGAFDGNGDHKNNKSTGDADINGLDPDVEVDADRGVNSDIDPGIGNDDGIQKPLDPFADVKQNGLGTVQATTPKGLVKGVFQSLEEQGFSVDGLTPKSTDKIVDAMQDQGIKVQFGEEPNNVPHIVDVSDSPYWDRGITDNAYASGEAAIPRDQIDKIIKIAEQNGVTVTK